MLFLCSERDVFANFGEHLRGDAEERGEVLQGKMLNNTGTTLQQQLIALAGCGAVEVDVAGAVLSEDKFADDTAQLHLFSVLTEKVHQLLAAHPKHAAGHHRLDRSLSRTTVEAVGIIGHTLALEREPCDVLLVVADAVCHVLEAPLGDEAEPPCGVALALQLFALAVLHHLALALAKLAQRLDV